MCKPWFRLRNEQAYPAMEGLAAGSLAGRKTTPITLHNFTNGSVPYRSGESRHAYARSTLAIPIPLCGVRRA